MMLGNLKGSREVKGGCVGMMIEGGDREGADEGWLELEGYCHRGD